MLSFNDAAAIAAAPTTASIDPALQQLLAERIHDWTAIDLLGQTHLLIVQPGDTEAAIVQEIAFSLLVDPIGGLRFGSQGFVPFWDWLEDIGGWFEMIVTVGNSGFAFQLFIQNAEGVDPELLNLCRTYAGEVR